MNSSENVGMNIGCFVVYELMVLKDMLLVDLMI